MDHDFNKFNQHSTKKDGKPDSVYTRKVQFQNYSVFGVLVLAVTGLHAVLHSVYSKKNTYSEENTIRQIFGNKTFKLKSTEFELLVTSVH